MKAKTFWLVWCDGGCAPTYKHDDYSSASREAKRLAREHPGNKFVVMESMSAFVIDAMQEIEFANDADIPF